MGDDGLRIRPALREEMGFFLDRAAEEGWNPGLGDGEPFFAADPEGFLLGFLGEEPVGCVSAVAYGGTFGFLGFYIVRSPFRGRGYGLRLWKRGLEHLAGLLVGLDGVVAQQENYRRSGFRYAHRNVRFRGKGTGTGESAPFVTSLAEVSLEDLCRFDRAFFPERRREFLRLWRDPQGGAGAAWIREGVLEGYATYFSGHGVHVPPVVSAILTHLEETGGLRGHHRVVGSGIGIYLAAEMKKRGTVVTLMSHRQLLDRFHERGGLDPEEGIVNCSRVSVPGCVVNLSDNPREISRLTVQYLFGNLRALEGTAP